MDIAGYLKNANGTIAEVKRAKTSVASNTTDGEVVAAVSAKRIRVLAAVMSPAAAVTGVTFNTKPGGAGTAISALFTVAASTVQVLPYNPHGWFQTTAGEGLSATTSASGVATGIQVTYVEVTDP